LFYKFLLENNIQPFPPKSLSINPDKYTIALASLLLINILLHLYPISFPLTIGDDEAAHASSGIGLIIRFFRMQELDPHKYFGLIRIISWILSLSAIMLFSFKNTRSFMKRSLSVTKSKQYMLFIAGLFFISIIIFFVTRDMKFYLALMRYPPIGKILYAYSTSLFGINEFAVRIPQLLFATFSSIFIYRICADNFDSNETGLVSACLYAFSPMVFYYSALGELICGTVFFSIIVIYFYLKYVKTNNNGYLLMSFYLVSLGFLYKRVIVLMLAVLFISILFLKENKVKLPFLFKLCYFSLVPILPYLIIGKIYPNNPFGLDLSNWLDPAPAFGYLAVLRKQLSYPLLTLAAVSAIFIFFRKMILKPAVFVSFTCFFLYYFLYTSSTLNSQLYPLLYKLHESGGVLIGTERYSMIFFPFIAISTGLFIDKITKLIKWKHSFKLVFSVIAVYSILICTIWQVPPLNAQFVMYKNIESHYFPIDKSMKWVKENVKDGEKILILRIDPSIFYRDRYAIDRDKIIDFWYNIQEVSTPDKLKAFYSKNKISYIMFPYGFTDNAEIMEYLKGHQGNEFTEVAKFSLDKNYIYIYKIIT
jgi:hypothetical protein